MKLYNINNQTIAVFSYCMSNVDKDVPLYQEKVFNFFNIPVNIEIKNISHGDFLTNKCKELRHSNTIDVIIFFDIDCIPLSSTSIKNVLLKTNQNTICGIEQTCNCNLSPSHIYAGPACLAIPISVIKKIDNINFFSNDYCDVGQQFTYDCTRNNIFVNFLNITDCQIPQWRLGNTNKMFGIGTTYDDCIFHQFCIRDTKQQINFINKCKKIIHE